MWFSFLARDNVCWCEQMILCLCIALNLLHFAKRGRILTDILLDLEKSYAEPLSWCYISRVLCVVYDDVVVAVPSNWWYRM